MYLGPPRYGFDLNGHLVFLAIPKTPSLENYKAIGFVSNTGLDPLEDHKATKPAFNFRSS